MEQFKLEVNQDEIYLKVAQLDKAVCNMNIGRTHGLLVGPFISKVISETLMNRIDLEIREKGINFVRFMDDYEIFVYDETKINQITMEIEKTINKYGFSLNNEKTKYVPFPYVDKIDLEPVFNTVSSNLKTVNTFNHFVEIEYKKNQKGAIKYLISRLNEFDENIEILVSILINTIINNPNSVLLLLIR